MKFFKGMLLFAILALAYCSPVSNPKCQSDSIEEAQKSEHVLADFAINLYKNATAHQGDRHHNHVISPVSIALALALLENGANGQTREQLQRHLIDHHGATDDVLSIYSSLIKNLQIQEHKTRLEIANGLYHDHRVHLNENYQHSSQQCLRAEIHEVDFQNQLEKARQEINRYVSKKTEHKIDQLIKKDSLHSDAKIVLANAIYLKSAWEQSFDQHQTQEGPFYRNGHDHEHQQVHFMKTEGEYRHSEDEHVQVIELRYDQAELALYVLLPKQRDGIEQLEHELNGNRLRSILDNLSTKKVEIHLPKVEIHSSSDLKSILANMGLKNLFNEQADLGRLSDEKVHISEAVHEAHIQIDEKGTEATAANSHNVENHHNNFAAQDPIKFNADHPFLYTVVHSRTGAIVLIGKVSEIEEH